MPNHWGALWVQSISTYLDVDSFSLCKTIIHNGLNIVLVLFYNKIFYLLNRKLIILTCNLALTGAYNNSPKLVN